MQSFNKQYRIRSLVTQYLEHFFAEPDAVYFKSLGLNCIRIAVNYRHFEGERAIWLSPLFPFDVFS